jgi:protein-S-isoprenylcysteine O-methyltransferase Ste14
MKRDSHYVLRILTRWTIMTGLLSALMFAAAGTIKLPSIRAYIVTYSALLLVTMLAVDPRLAEERIHPGPAACQSHLQFIAQFFFLLTLTAAAFCAGRMQVLTVALPIRHLGLAIFALGGALQAWAMIANPFFSPTVRFQRERGHVLIDSGPYKFFRHPGYLAMCISVPASPLAIGSWLALFPAAGFIAVIQRRAEIEDQFLRANLPRYAEYARQVHSGLPLVRSM